MVLAAAAWLGTNKVCYNTCVGNIFLAFSLAGFALIYLRLNPKVGDVICLLGAGGLLSIVDIKALHYDFTGNGLLGLPATSLKSTDALPVSVVACCRMPVPVHEIITFPPDTTGVFNRNGGTPGTNIR